MTTATNTVQGQILMGGDLSPTSTGELPQLRASGVTPGSYPVNIGAIAVDGTAPVTSPTVVVDTKGRIIYAKSSSTTETIPIASTTTQGVVKVDGTSITIASGVISAPSLSNATTTTFGLVKPDNTSIVSNAGVLSRVVPTVTSTNTGLAQIGSNINVASGVISVNTGSSTLLGLVQPDNSSVTISGGTLSRTLSPTATSTVFGKVQPDNTTISISAGTISKINLTSTAFGLGFARPDNTTVTINAGVLSANAPSTATSSTVGVVIPDNTSIAVTGGVLYRTSPKATSATLGTVQPDNTTTVVDGSGVLSWTGGPQATSTTLGIVKPDNTTISISAGVISMTNPPTDATSSVLGKVRPDNTTITIDGNGILSSSINVDASSTTKGAVQIGLNFNISSGLLSAPVATTSTLGLAKVDGTTITSIGGVLSASLPPEASTSVFGIARPDNITMVNDSNGALSIPLTTKTSKGLVNIPGSGYTIIASGGGGSPVVIAGRVYSGAPSQGVPGLIKVDGTTISSTGGIISNLIAPSSDIASTSVFGIAQPDNLTLSVDSNGMLYRINYTVPTNATSTTFGLVKPDNSSTSVTSGVISAYTATSGGQGVLRVDGTTLSSNSGILSKISPAILTNIPQTFNGTQVNSFTFYTTGLAWTVANLGSGNIGFLQTDLSTVAYFNTIRITQSEQLGSFPEINSFGINAYTNNAGTYNCIKTKIIQFTRGMTSLQVPYGRMALTPNTVPTSFIQLTPTSNTVSLEILSLYSSSLNSLFPGSLANTHYAFTLSANFI